jgi:DNA-binding NtrC family response regulator
MSQPILLVVDDEKFTREAIADVIRERGAFNVLTAASGQEALKTAKETNLDIALLDILMPEMDGIQTLDEIKMISPDTEIIMVTAVDKDIPTAVDAMKKGAYDYITKPFNNDELLDRIEKAWHKKETVDRQRQMGAVIEESQIERDRRVDRAMRFVRKCEEEGRRPTHEEVAKILGHTIYTKKQD